MAMDSSKTTKGKTKTKAWNQRMGDKDVVLNKLYIDYKDSSKTVPCSLKFKTDRMTDTIELHKVKFNAKYGEKEGMKVQWDDDPKQNGCLSVLTITQKDLSESNEPPRKIFTAFFYQSGLVLCQGKYMNHYQDFVFPQVIAELQRKKTVYIHTLTQQIENADTPVETMDLDNTTSKVDPMSTPLKSVTENQLKGAISKRLNDLRQTPVTPQFILHKHFTHTEERIEKLEHSLLEIMDNQSHQFEAWSNLFDKQSKILSENVAERTGKFNQDVIQKVIEEKINEVLLQKDFQMKSDIENIINDKMKVNAVQYSEISDMQDRIKDLEQISFDKGNLIEKLNEEKISLEIELEKADKKVKEHEPCLLCKNNDVLSLEHSEEERNDKSGMQHESVKETEEPDMPVTEQDIKEDKYEDILLNKKEEITIPVEVLTKMLDELEELKNNREKEWQFKPLQHKKNIEIFCDSFGKHIDENRCFGKDNATNINICFTTTQLLDTARRKQKDESVTHVLIQCGFNDLKQPNSESHVINRTKAAIELLESKFREHLYLLVK